MVRKILLPTILALLVYGFWISPDFKQIAAGVAVFLFGMYFLEEGFRIFSGGLLERLLHSCTNRLYKSLSFGIVTTTLMQSSSLVSVITISFLSTGMIGLHQGLGIVFGANLGTTTGAWLVAGFGLKVKISAYALPLLVLGIVLVLQRVKALKGIGYILAGLGFLFLGIHYMKEGFETFKDTFDLAGYAIPGVRGLFIFLLIGTAATVVMQSSHATLVLIITALASNQITYENALALAIGANIGTTITAIIGSMGAKTQGKRLAGGHLMFNLATGLIAIAAIRPFIALVDIISNAVGIAADDHSLRLAVFHTVFNLVGIIVMTPLLGTLVRLLERILPTRAPELARPLYLTDAAVEFSDTALKAVQQETEHLYENAFVLLAHGIDLHRGEILSDQDLSGAIEDRKEPIEIEFDEDYTQTVKVVYSAIVEFVSKAQARLSPEDGERIHPYRLAARHIVEAVKSVKHLRKNLCVYIHDDNPHIRKAYNDIRISLGNVLREVASLRKEAAAGATISVAQLDELRSGVESADVLASGTVDELIRDDLISAEMASSLMNDSSYRTYTTNHIVAMAECLYACDDGPEEQDERRRLAQGERELREAANASSAVKPSFPKYVNQEDVLESPHSILEAAHAETVNLYKKAFFIMSHGIALHRSEIKSEEDLATIVNSPTERPAIDIDEDYEQTVKVLYAAIIRFVGKARIELPLEEANELLELRLAARHIVEAVKCVKHLRKNLSVYVVSDNRYIRRAYNDIRILLGKVLRGMKDARQQARESKPNKAVLQSLRKLVSDADILANGSLDLLVRDELITPWMATSLTNDSAYAQHAALHLINMAETVFTPDARSALPESVQDNNE